MVIDSLSKAAAALLLLAALSFPPPAAAQRGDIAPEAASGFHEKALAAARRHMVAAAHPLAAAAGREMLRQGGNAVDAAIATQLVLGLVEPQSSGLGGGAFVVYWNAQKKVLETWDGRETAPAAARPDRFFSGGKPMPFARAVHSGLSVGVPGTVRLMETLHARHGRLPWDTLIAPAVRLAEEGFPVSLRLHFLLRWLGAESFAPAARRYFFDGKGAPHPEGHLLRNPDYAATLRAVAREGAKAFYGGPIAAAILDAVKNAPNAAGDMTAADLANYTVKERPPLCFAYRERRICGMGPPSSGGPTVAATLLLLEPFDLGRGPSAALSPRAMHLIAEAEKLAYADRDRYIADPGFAPVPAGLLDPGYLASRRLLISPSQAMTHPPPAGAPPGASSKETGIDGTQESAGTSHVSIVDDAGNALAMTTTIEAMFGSRLFAAGFLLNNELTDFSFQPADAGGRPVANRVEGGKRPRSSMAPTIVFGRGGGVEAVLGSPGGSRIILYVVKTLVALIDWQLDAQAAAGLLNFGSRGQGFDLETGWQGLGPAVVLAGYGHEVVPDLMTSGTHVIVVKEGRIEGGADPRREGAALGD